MTKYIPVRQQLWQEPVFSPEEGEEFAPTRHQVDRWKAEASNFPATLDELPYGRRDWWDILATRAYQAGRASVTKPVAEGLTDEELYELWVQNGFEINRFARAAIARWGRQPAPPAEGEVAELVEWLHRRAAEVQAENCTTIYSPHLLRRVADLLAQRHPAPQPVPEVEGPTDEELPEDFIGFEKGFAQEHLARLMRDAIGTETNHNAYIVAAGRILDRPEFAHVARWGRPTPQPVPVPGEAVEVAAWLRLFCSEEYESLGNSHDPDVAWLTRAAELLEQRHLAPVPVIELPQGWHMLCDIEPEPGTVCDWVIMAPWGCDHGSGKWPDHNGVPPREFFDVPVGWPVYYKGFASADGVMVSDPKLTAWRAQPLPAGEVK